MKEKIKEWYRKTFPTDELGKELNSKLTFQDLFDVLDARKSVYDNVGVADSVVRERLFSRLADLIEADYGYIYDQWMLCEKG